MILLWPLGVKNKHPNDMYYDEVGPCNHMIGRPHLRFNSEHNWRTYVIIGRRRRFFSLETLSTSTSSTPIMALEGTHSLLFVIIS